MTGFILASSSESRLVLLKKMGFVPDSVVPSCIDESNFKNEEVRCYAKRMSEGKASVVSMLHPTFIVLAADTVAARGSIILPKGVTDDDVRYSLNLLSGRRHRVYTAVSLAIPGNKIRTKVVMTVVRFKRLTQSEIEGYVLSKEGIGKAGCYSIQGRANLFIHYIGGSFTNVIGLPMYEVACLLNSVNIVPKWDSDFIA